MTRYSNPLPHNQVPPNQVPHSQGRPAGAGQQQPAYTYPPQPEPDPATGWPSQGVPRTGGRPAGSSYPNGSYGDQQASAHHDPYAALRPDGYGYAQPAQPAADPYGLAGYTAPQPQAGQSYPRSAQPSSYDAFGGAGDPYGNNGAFGYGSQSAAAAPGSFGAAKPAAPAQQAPSFGPYGAQPQASPYAGGYSSAPQNNGYSPQNPLADQWGAQGLALDPRDYDGNGYGTSGVNAGVGPQGHWGGDGYGDPHMDPALAQQGYANGQQHASFDQSYADDDAQYEDEPRRSSWKKVATLVASTVVVGSGLVFAYGSIMGPGTSGPTPVVKGAEGPAKVKPSEPGGKQFAHADSKIMGRLGEGETPEAGTDAGVRKVPVVVVGRDGSIQPPPAAAPEDQTRAVVTVPGLTVIDGLGGSGPSPNRPAGPSAQQQQQQQAASPPAQTVTAADAEKPIVVEPPKQPSAKKPTNLIANAETSEPAAVQTKATPAPPKKERTVVAAADPVATGPKPTGAGYVAVLASVPASNSSRIDALKQFADMQQKYGTILQNKTPDVQEANLGEKGTYHRLLVGPPGSRDSASSVCTQLKAEGYSGCWVTAY
jgi:hypothetical protein